ncbi:radical SAM family heme chaperone HemW [Pelosinus fermentans]|uniref:Heme chaperone HemW n=1 Tax=Pelosinus fermentans JBW45 TaxID=1192197 RepID=I9NV48_9FIRM|nr:radical SAM family heme chaperone HemW [Pelosinus fermentans]AJQ27218.1 oxygen-independent coproporphyrinogen III oxidase [Pelosinus fermentans JBW45]
MKTGLYIHIPFCQQKCLYCDFPSYDNLTHLYQPYVAALCQEISGWGGVLSGTLIDTIYIGGGTPTLLPADALKTILTKVHESFSIDAAAEISVEANPGTTNQEKLLALKSGGVNRISFGVQTFSDALLMSIGRIHSAEQAERSVKEAQDAGFSNINLDLMYGLPGQSCKDLKVSIQEAIKLDVTHISAYGLKVEEGTPFAAMDQLGTLILPEEDDDEEMYTFTTEYLPQHGFRRYEISNFSKVGYECRHNFKYWKYHPYAGVGAAAHSFFQKERLSNITDVSQYIDCVKKGKLPIEFRENPSIAIAMAEYIFLALRTVQGLSILEFQEYFNRGFYLEYGEIVSELLQKKLIAVKENQINLTVLGMKYGNVVFRAFLPG